MSYQFDLFEPEWVRCKPDFTQVADLSKDHLSDLKKLIKELELYNERSNRSSP